MTDRHETIGRRMMVMVPRPIALVITDADKQAACDLIGNDTYGMPVWTIETISPENRVVQAFARHRIAAEQGMFAALTQTTGQSTTPLLEEGV